jgi:cellulose synthase/poly-beta-1,6-N-acetylglucosamine synthase-like glycosyltransferase
MALIITLAQLGLWLALGIISFHLLRSARWAWSRPLGSLMDEPLADPPMVTVQLPIRNEGPVAERVVRAACALDWPRQRLEVQVLDDSDDATSARLDQVAAELRAAGHDITLLRRASRRGFKAGNLQHGLEHAAGELIAVLDADAVPPPDFLRKLVPPLLDDPGLGFTQARWSFDDEGSSLLLRVQALVLHGLMLVEQPRLSAFGEPLPFNGSGGVWRRAALEAAGGWLSEESPLTEDLNAAYRARIEGWRGLQVPEVAICTELPATMGAFREQQKRWVCGAGQVLRRLGHRASSFWMLAHLLRHARQPYLVALTLWLPWTTLDVIHPRVASPLVWSVIMALAFVSIGLYYGAALRRLGRPAIQGFLLAPVVLALSLGLSLCLAVALLRGLAGQKREFLRTPKRGDGAKAIEQAPLDRLAYVEVAIGIVYVGLAVVSLMMGAWTTALVLGGLFAAGYLWVGLGSILDR